MKVLLSQLPKYPWWGSGTPVYENNWAMKIGVIPDHTKVQDEYLGVYDALKKHTDLQVIPFPEELDANVLNKHDAIFVRDSFISNQKGDIVISHFTEKERQSETKHLEKYLEKENFKLHYLPDHAYAEGGEFFYSREENFLFAGISRSNKKGVEETAKLLGVKDLFIVESDSFHLDTIFTSILNSEGRIVGMLVCLALVKNADEVKKFAKKYNMQLIDVIPNDAINFDGNGNISVNCLPVPGKLIGGCAFETLGAEDQIRELHVEHVIAPITQFLYSGGGVHCLTNELLY